LHIISGESSAGALKQAFGTYERLYVFRDHLAQGPVCDFSDLESWNSFREEYLNDLYKDILDVNYSGGFHNIVADLSWLDSDELIYIWVTTGVQEQLFLLFIIHLIELVTGNVDRIRIIAFESMPDNNFIPYSMGNISPKQMQMYPEPVEISQEHHLMFQNAWKALTYTSPDLMCDFITKPTNINKSIINTFKLLLRHYPDIKTGLSHWEYKLLLAAKQYGPGGARIIAEVIGAAEGGDSVGDYYLLSRLKYLSDKILPEPIFILSGDLTSFRKTSVLLTDVGEKILAHKMSYCDVNPVNDWVGGVHLSTEKGRLWLNNNGQIVGVCE